jgi:hypothetical protein
MTTILRAAAAAFLGAMMASNSLASTLEDAVRDSSWADVTLVNPAERATVEPVDAFQLENPIELVTACEAACGASDACCDDPCCDSACDDGCDCGEGCLDCGDACGCGPKWIVSGGVIFLKRDRPVPGTTIAANPAGTRFASASDFSFDWEAGPDVGIARRFSGGTILEARYFGVDSVDRTSLVTPGGFIGGGFTGPGGTNFDNTYLSMLDSTEINLRREVSDRLSLLAGFRWVELKDEAFYKLNGNVATGDYEFNNRLYGLQLGGMFNAARPQSRVIAGIGAKAGVYGNVADGGIFEFQGNNFIGSFVDSDTTTSFVGELDFTLGYRLTNHLILRSGYQLLWLDRVALAGDAASRSLLNPSLLRDIDYNDLFYQGVTTGIDVTW